jgi:hypothetical protein
MARSGRDTVSFASASAARSLLSMSHTPLRIEIGDVYANRQHSDYRQ